MKTLKGVKIKLDNPGFPASTDVLTSEGERLLVHWPIDIHIGPEGAFATLKIPVSELDITLDAHIDEVLDN